MATLKAGTTIGGQIPWTAGNDGPGSGLDADLVDGKHATGLRATVSPTAPTPTRVGELWIDTDDLVLTETSWVYPTLMNGWVNYHPTWSQARFSKMYGNTVFVEGLIAGGTKGGTAFILPAGYRPAYYLFAASQHNPNTGSIFQVYPDGQLVPWWTTAGDSGWHSIHGFFYADA